MLVACTIYKPVHFPELGSLHTLPSKQDVYTFLMYNHVLWSFSGKRGCEGIVSAVCVLGWGERGGEKREEEDGSSWERRVGEAEEARK